MCASEKRDFGNLSLSALPGTDKECAGLKAQAEASGKPIRVFLGADATEAQLRAIDSPRILHLATHGFFLPESKDEHRSEEPELGTGKMNVIGGTQKDGKTSVILKNPMHRSGLALTGAQRTLEAWAKGGAPPSDNDGIIMAEEVGGLKLEGTWLAVLSACDTGTGGAKSGRRGDGPAPWVHSIWSAESLDDALADQRRDDSADYAQFLRACFCERECPPVAPRRTARVASEAAQGEGITLRGQSCGAIYHVVPGHHRRDGGAVGSGGSFLQLQGASCIGRRFVASPLTRRHVAA
jgi:hypothetical protein